MPVLTFPVHAPVDGRCGCSQPGCEAKPGKHPKIKGWSQILESVPAEEGDNVGILCGAPSGILVVDEDVVDAAAPLLLPETYTVRTHAGRKHYYYRHPGFYVKSKSYWPGVDVKADGGYVLAPGSVHASGEVYSTLLDVPIASLPEAIVSFLQALNAGAGSRGSSVTPIGPEHPTWERRIREAAAWLAKQEPSVAGSGGHGRLFFVACKLVRFWELPQETSLALLQRFFNPRCDPAWSDRELVHKLESAATDSDEIPGGCELVFTVNDRVLPARSANAGRKKHNPDHRYTFDPGNCVPAKREVPVRDKEGNIVGTKTLGPRDVKDLSEVITDMAREATWDGVWQYDDFKKRTVAVDPPCRLEVETPGDPSKADLSAIRTWFESQRAMRVSSSEVRDAIEWVAKANRFHPIKEYLEALAPASGAIDRFVETCLPIQNEHLGYLPEFKKMVRMTLIGSVARIYDPGAKFDTGLVLQGPQNLGKSGLIWALYGKENCTGVEWGDDTANLVRKCRGRWAVEFGEMAGKSKKTVEEIKMWMTTTDASHVAKYVETAKDEPRTFAVWATTNDVDLLSDPTGDRRWLIVPIGDRVPWHDIDRDGVWAEALEAYRSGETWWTEPGTELEAKFREMNRGWTIESSFDLEPIIASLPKGQLLTTKWLKGRIWPGRLTVDNQEVSDLKRALGFLGYREKRPKDVRFWSKS